MKINLYKKKENFLLCTSRGFVHITLHWYIGIILDFGNPKSEKNPESYLMQEHHSQQQC